MALNDSWNAIYLGRTDVVDTREGLLNFTAENASALTGKTFGSGSEPLFRNIVEVSTNNRDTDAWLDQNGGGDGFTTTLPGAHAPRAFGFDAVVSYDAVVTYKDGTAASIRVNLFQDPSGETFLAPDLQDAQNAVLGAGPIVSLTLGAPAEVESVGLGVCRDSVFVPCFTAGTLIATDRGEVAVEALAPGDLVRTRDAGLQPVRWIGTRVLSAADLGQAPNMRPIRIRAGALGAGTPAADLVVSPQHRVLVRSRIAVRMFGAEEVLVAAKQLLQLDGIDVAEDLAEVAYVHFLCDDHQVVFSNGAETESLYTGPEAMKAVGAAAREEILALFPALRDSDPAALPRPARVLASGRMGRRLALRHADRGRPLVS